MYTRSFRVPTTSNTSSLVVFPVYGCPRVRSSSVINGPSAMCSEREFYRFFAHFSRIYFLWRVYSHEISFSKLSFFLFSFCLTVICPLSDFFGDVIVLLFDFIRSDRIECFPGRLIFSTGLTGRRFHLVRAHSQTVIYSLSFFVFFFLVILFSNDFSSNLVIVRTRQHRRSNIIQSYTLWCIQS